MTTKLQLDILTTYNPQVLRVIDDSYYNENVPVECGVLLVTPPGFNYPAGYSPDPYFSMVLNSASLGLTQVCTGCQLAELPDGIYVLHYSIKPNDKVWVEYNHMRTTLALIRYAKMVCALRSRRDQYTSSEFDLISKKLRDIKDIIDNSKIMVEVCHQAQEGLAMYDQAWKELGKLETKIGKCQSC